ncbi:MAG: hypothetical protein WEB00_01665 [Dehalococcoidia bacterium]
MTRWMRLVLALGATVAITTGCAQPLATLVPIPAEGEAESAPPEAPAETAQVAVTYYTCEDGFCGTTASGATVHPGTAACDSDWMGRSFTMHGDPYGMTYTCEDTGGGVHGNHVDIWFQTHAEGKALIDAVGTSATIEFVD